MAATQIATGVTATGATTGVTVTENRCYCIQIVWTTGDATVLPQFSVDGTNYFDLAPPPTNVSNTGSSRTYKIVDMPVTKMRLYVSAISGGASVSAHVSAV